MKLLLHGCCTDCTLKFIESIKEENELDQFSVYYYNPNIHPRSEYQSRLKAMQLMIENEEVKLIIPDWRPVEYFEGTNPSALRAPPSSKEDLRTYRGALNKAERCIRCWELRLENTAKFAKENGFTHFSSTLITSQYQNSEKVIEIGERVAKKYEIEFYVPKLICTDLETKGFYKQIFCGCCYSLVERFEEKFKNVKVKQ